MYGRPLDFVQSTCVFVTSPLPPALTANALFFPSDMNRRSASYSSRVIFPSLFVSSASKKPANSFPPSSREMAPSPSLSNRFSSSSNGGIWFSFTSSGPPGDQPAKNTVPSATTGEGQHPDGMPPTDHRSSPVFRS